VILCNQVQTLLLKALRQGESNKGTSRVSQQPERPALGMAHKQVGRQAGGIKVLQMAPVFKALAAAPTAAETGADLAWRRVAARGCER
jgi:hypothetical protein